MKHSTQKINIYDKTLSFKKLDSDPYITLQSGTWEPWQLKLYKQILHEDSVCIDVGANYGYNSLAMSILNPNGKVYSFEAAPAIFDILKDNTILNDRENISFFNLAITDKPEVSIPFTFYINSPAQSHIAANSQYELDAIQVNIPGTSLDEFCISNDINPNFIKIDIEGNEIKALQGAKKLLQNHDISWVIEFSPENLYLLNGEKFLEDICSILTGFEHIYLLKRNETLFQVTNYALLIILLFQRHGVEDIFCFNDSGIINKLLDSIEINNRIGQNLTNFTDLKRSYQATYYNFHRDYWGVVNYPNKLIHCSSIRFLNKASSSDLMLVLRGIPMKQDPYHLWLLFDNVPHCIEIVEAKRFYKIPIPMECEYICILYHRSVKADVFGNKNDKRILGLKAFIEDV